MYLTTNKIKKNFDGLMFATMNIVPEDMQAEAFDYIMSLVKEGLDIHELRVVKKPLGESQEISYDNFTPNLLKEEWCNQRCVSMEGDSYEGEVSIKVSDNWFLQINYSC